MLPVLITTWGLTTAQAGYLATATLLSAAIGGHRRPSAVGRVVTGRTAGAAPRVMQFTTLWFAVFTVVAGFSQNFEQLIVIRVLQGLGFGGEWAAGGRSQHRRRLLARPHALRPRQARSWS
ncbi:hypothetical protein QQM39_40960 [Streptomyces sp. DT2A-34]|uniref:hypothetical protein n=1 Tax=Streptomyces sp. DT2A-34 TaxID=3051182 RepID=UPI00265B7A38|nr:hypothetical protein [Streptomyces sp. DT2A-34]MDO0916953.1 hypothetical protein [Streptomyces sp. DT2A-34]